MTVSGQTAHKSGDFERVARRIGAAVSQRFTSKGWAIASLVSKVHHPAAHEDAVLHIDVTLADGFELPFSLAHWSLHERNFDMSVDSLVRAVARGVALQPRIEAFLAFAREKAERTLGSTTAGLLRVALARFDAAEPPLVREIMVETVFQALDAALRPVTMIMQNRRRDILVQELRSKANNQKLRQRQLDRLARLDAIVEISAPAEAVIAERGLTVGYVAGELLRVDPGAFGFRSSSATSLEGLVLQDGLIQYFGDVGPVVNAASLLGDQLRIFEQIDAQRCAELRGQPAATLYDHPAVRASGRISSIRLDNGATDIRFRSVRRRALRVADIDGDRAAA